MSDNLYQESDELPDGTGEFHPELHAADLNREAGVVADESLPHRDGGGRGSTMILSAGAASKPTLAKGCCC